MIGIKYERSQDAIIGCKSCPMPKRDAEVRPRSGRQPAVLGLKELLDVVE